MDSPLRYRPRRLRPVVTTNSRTSSLLSNNRRIYVIIKTSQCRNNRKTNAIQDTIGVREGVTMKKKSSRGYLVKAYAERISAELLEKHGDTVRSVIGRKCGVYVLSKHGKPYYIGLASKLPSRLRHHLKDRHAHKWDRFNFYAIRSQKHIKDIESILILVAQPEGNKQRAGFGKGKDVRKTLRNEIIKSIKDDFDGDRKEHTESPVHRARTDGTLLQISAGATNLVSYLPDKLITLLAI